MFLGHESQSGRSAAGPDAADAIYLSYRMAYFNLIFNAILPERQKRPLIFSFYCKPASRGAKACA